MLRQNFPHSAHFERASKRAVVIVTALAAIVGTACLAACTPVTNSTKDSGTQADTGTADASTSAGGSYIYKTGVASGFIHPELTIPSFGSSMTGSYTINNTAADFDEIYKGGGGTLTAGRLEGSLSGDTFSGYWYETAGEGGYGSVQRTCDPAKAGVLVYGRFSFTFSADRKTFTGTMSTCEDEVKGATEWNGTLTRRGQP